MTPILYDGIDPILCSGRALYELIQCVNGQPNNHAQACHRRMQCFLSTVPFTLLSNNLSPKIVSEYDQEIPQSQTADNPVAPLGRAAQPSRDTRKTNQAKQPALSSPSR